jgi:predicted nucleic acid-binding protein
LPERDVDKAIIDASAALKAALIADGFAAKHAVRLHAPTLLWSEAASGASQLRWRGDITTVQADAAMDRLLAAGIEFSSSRELVTDALALARRLGWAKTYDAEYIVLARRLDVPFVTIDGRLAATARRHVRVLVPSDLTATESAGGS